MDYEIRLNTLRSLYLKITDDLKKDPVHVTPERRKESEFHLKQIESEINRIAKMRSYKKDN